MKKIILLITAILFLPAPLISQDRSADLDYAQVTAVSGKKAASGRWRFSVTVRHNDSGWDHYANVWQVIDGETEEILGERILAHPHVNEQPFTRSLSGVRIPAETSVIVFRARCNAHDFRGQQISVRLEDYEAGSFSIPD